METPVEHNDRYSKSPSLNIQGDFEDQSTVVEDTDDDVQYQTNKEQVQALLKSKRAQVSRHLDYQGSGRSTTDPIDHLGGRPRRTKKKKSNTSSRRDKDRSRDPRSLRTKAQTAMPPCGDNHDTATAQQPDTVKQPDNDIIQPVPAAKPSPRPNYLSSINLEQMKANAARRQASMLTSHPHQILKELHKLSSQPQAQLNPPRQYQQQQRPRQISESIEPPPSPSPSLTPQTQRRHHPQHDELEELHQHDNDQHNIDQHNNDQHYNDQHNNGQHGQQQHHQQQDLLQQHHHHQHLQQRPTMVDHAPTDTSSRKLSSLLDFLDQVDSSHRTLEQELELSAPSTQPQTYHHVSHAPTIMMEPQPSTFKQPEYLTKASETTASVTAIITQQRVELQEKDRMLLELRQRVETQELKLSKGSAHEVSVLESQLEECNTTINRHLKFIDRLIKDKKEISVREKELSARLKVVDDKHAQKLAAVQGSRQLDLKRQKDALIAAEKSRKDKWIKEQTKRIKDMTIKGLAPEIQRLVSEHKAEIQRIKSVRSGEFGEFEESLRREHHAAVVQLKRDCEEKQATEVALAVKQCQNKFLEQVEVEERSFQEERRRLNTQIQREKQLCEERVKEIEKDAQDQIAAIRDVEARSNENSKADAERLLQDVNRRHDQELRQLKEQLKIERESWEDMFLRKQSSQLKVKEVEIRDQLRKERDQQIAMVIERLEAESRDNTRENDEQYNVRLNRIQEKLDLQLKDAEQSERTCLNKYNDSRQRLAQASEELASVRGTLMQRDQDLARAQETCSRLTKERENLSDVLRTEFAETLASNETEIEGLRRDLKELQVKSKQEITTVHKAKDTEIETLHQRVQATITKKDETIQNLREQTDSATRRADHLEELLETQRQHLQ